MDIKTIVLALALGNLSLCAALFFYDFERKKPLALTIWLFAKQCQAAAWLLLFVPFILPDALLVPVAYSLLFAGLALEAGALWESEGRPGWRRVLVPLGAAAMLAFLACYVVDSGPGVRALIASLTIVVFYLAAAGALARGWSGASMLRRYLVVSMALLVAVVGARGLQVLLAPEGWNGLSNAMLQLLSYGAMYLLMLQSGFGYLLLAREKHQLELERLAVVDTLTEVPNRRGFFNILAPWMSLARRPGQPTSLIVFDFDSFKRVNDSYGHPVGDTVLRTIIEVCKTQLRDSDQLGRLGGVEFAVLLPRTELSAAALVAERMRAAIAANPVKTERAVINLTVSMGVTTVRADDSNVSLFKRADEAMQTAKLTGRNRVVEAEQGAPQAT